MRLILAAVFAAAIALPVQAAETSYFNSKTEKPLKLKHRKKQVITDAVTQFHETGANPYAGDKAALDDGGKLYQKRCKACHAADGSGKVGPSLQDEEWMYARTDTEVGRFEIIYGGGKGSMRGFGRQMDQDDILKVMAYIDLFRSDDPGVKAAVIKEEKKATPGQSQPPVPFTEEYMNAAANVENGGEIWAAQCRHCHGAKAYPGKAPKLKPAKYKPNFVYRRVTDGFRKMPAWKDEYTDDERMQIVAYIMSGSFSP